MSSPLFYAPVSDHEDSDASTAYQLDLNGRSRPDLPSQCSSVPESLPASSTIPSPALTSPRAESLSKSRRLFSLSVFSLTTTLLFADQNLMAPNLTAIARDFGFNDEERDQRLGGQIAMAFFVLGAPASYLVGCMADSDKLSRSTLFAVTVGVGEGACLLTYFSTTYRGLFICRAVTGFSLGGAVPLIYSVLGDLFAAEDRHAVNAFVGIGTGLGISVGQGVAGFIGPNFGWRLPFLVISIPALLCALIVLFFVEDPPRGGTENALQPYRDQMPGNYQEQDRGNNAIEIVPLDPSNRSLHTDDDRDGIGSAQLVLTKSFRFRESWATFAELLSTPSVLLALLQGAPGCIPWGIVNAFLNDFLSQDRGMTVEFATLTILFFGAGNFCGMLLGGFGGSYLYRLDCRYPAILAGLAAVGSCFPFWVLLNLVNASTSVLWTATIGFASGILSGITGPVIKATLQNVTLPQARGQAFALFNTFDDFGRGLGPVFVAGLVAGLGGRTAAFNVGVLGWAICGIFNLLIFCTVQRDEMTVQSTLLAQFSLQSSTSLSQDVGGTSDIDNEIQRDIV